MFAFLISLLAAASAVRLPRLASRGGLVVAQVTAESPPAATSALPAENDFPRTWVPLASTFELDPERPTPVRFLGKSYVVWRGNDGEWRVFDDACPHRLAPLSEGRIDRETDRLECAYHGWSFEASGSCARIPQANEAVSAAATPSPRACVASYPSQVEKSVLWVWPWAEADPLSALTNERAWPAAFLAGVKDDASTYTRDLPYGWDTLLENIVDPSHIPFAHHGLQGKRDDAIAINMTTPTPVGEGGAAGFTFEFGDRTMGKRRAGTGEFRAVSSHADPNNPGRLSLCSLLAERPGFFESLIWKPFVVSYNADFEPTIDKKTGEPRASRPFNLTVVCIPTGPGRSRAIIFGGAQPKPKRAKHATPVTVRGTWSSLAADSTAEATPAAAEAAAGGEEAPAKKKTSLVGRIFAALPVWLTHILSNRFLDSDLAFLHYQEQALRERGGHGTGQETRHYFMPAPADRCIGALRKWIATYAHVPGPLPPPEYTRQILFDRWTQHTSHCVHCTAAIASLARWRTNTYRVLAVAMLSMHALWPSRIAGVLCVGMLRLYAALEQQFKYSDYQHWKNN